VTVTRRVAVTGATGFIGRHLTAHLAARGFEVRAVVRRGPTGFPAFSRNVVVVQAPLAGAALTHAFAGVDCVVHLAGVISALTEAEYMSVNVEGTRAVAEAARSVHTRLVHVSSLAAAGPASSWRPRAEDDPSTPITPYGRSKLESERVVASLEGLRWIVLRPGVVYGPGDRALLPLFRFARLGVLPLVGSPRAAYTFIHVADLVRAIEAAIDANMDRETIFAGAPAPVTARELLEGIRAATGGRAVILQIPRAVTRLAATAGDLAGAVRGRRLILNRWRYRELFAGGFVCRVDRLRERLGVVAEMGLTEGLAMTGSWYRQQGWL
jgi:nucleoside-diphosphate-sugar epimerase